MEIKTAFRVLVGILLILTVVLAAVVIAGNLLGESVFIEECTPAEYIATRTTPIDIMIDSKKIRLTPECGFDSTGQHVYCEPTIDIQKMDTCMDDDTNKCCPTSQSGCGGPGSCSSYKKDNCLKHYTDEGCLWWKVLIVGERCCNATVI